MQAFNSTSYIQRVADRARGQSRVYTHAAKVDLGRISTTNAFVEPMGSFL